MEVARTAIPGLHTIRLDSRVDERGQLTKVFTSSGFLSALEYDFVIREQYFSISRRGVLRGMHFQRPPADHDKLVLGLEGEAVDVVVDVRKGSPSYGRVFSVLLGPSGCHGLLIPRGCAHGFLVTGASAHRGMDQHGFRIRKSGGAPLDTERGPRWKPNPRCEDRSEKFYQ